MNYFSIDHEVLTDKGWKWANQITTFDNILSITNEYIKPYSINVISNNTSPLICMKNKKMNIFGTFDLKIHVPFSKEISLYEVYLHGVSNHHESSDNINKDVEAIYKSADSKAIETQLVEYITVHNKHVSLKKDMSKVDFHSRYLLIVFKEYYNRDDILNSETISLHKTKGTSIIRIFMSNNECDLKPICIRRNDCISWIMQ